MNFTPSQPGRLITFCKKKMIILAATFLCINQLQGPDDLSCMKAELTVALIEGSADMSQFKELASISSLIAPLATIHGNLLSFMAFGPDIKQPLEETDQIFWGGGGQ